jgi:hypothetical protein
MVELQTLCTTGAWTLYFCTRSRWMRFYKSSCCTWQTHDLGNHTSDYRLSWAADDTWHDQPHDWTANASRRSSRRSMVENGLQVTRAWWSFFSLRDSSARVLIILMASASHERQENPSMHACTHGVKNWVWGLGNGATHCLHDTFCSQCVPEEVPNGTSSNNGSFKPSVHPLAN